MQMLVNGFRQCFADAFDLFQILFAGGNDAAQAAEAGEQGLAAFAAYAGDIAEGRGNAGFVAFFAVAGDGEAVRFVAHGLQEVQGGAVGRQAENFAGEREDEFFHAGFAFGAFGDADQGDVQPEFFPYGYGDADLSFAAVNQYDIGPFDAFAVGFGFLHFAVAAGEDFAHGGVVVAGFGGSFQNISRLPEYLKARGKIFEVQRVFRLFNRDRSPDKPYLEIVFDESGKIVSITVYENVSNPASGIHLM